MLVFPKQKRGNPSKPVRPVLRVKLNDFIDPLCKWKRLRCRKWSYFSWKSRHVFFSISNSESVYNIILPITRFSHRPYLVKLGLISTTCLCKQRTFNSFGFQR